MSKLITRSGKLISRGGNLISKSAPPPPAACWEGIMTVGGSISIDDVDIIGYIEGIMGSITNLPILNCSSEEIDQIYWGDNDLIVANSVDTNIVVNEIEIDGVVYNMNGSQVLFASNPFPPVGETCVIKILS